MTVRGSPTEGLDVQGHGTTDPGSPGLIDTHCHCLPGVDDGPEDLEEAMDLCRMLVAEGVHMVIATPHQLGRYDGGNTPAEIRQQVAQLNHALTQRGIRLDVLPGAEVRIDERIVSLLQHDRILTLGDLGAFVLLELPHETFLDIGPLLVALSKMGVRGVLAHTERSAFLAANPQFLMNWADARPIVQINASSLVGDLGHAVQKAAWALLDLPLEAIVASDAHHAQTRPPRLIQAMHMLDAKAPHVAQRVFRQVPWQIARTYGSGRRGTTPVPGGHSL